MKNLLRLMSTLEYIKKILPKNIEQNYVRIKAYFCKVLEQHPRFIKQMREPGRYFDFKI